VQDHIKKGTLKKFERLRQSPGTAGLKKNPIAEERTAYLWAVLTFVGAPAPEIAEMYPPPRGWQGNPTEVAAQKRKRADQIRKRVLQIFQELGLPRPARK